MKSFPPKTARQSWSNVSCRPRSVNLRAANRNATDVKGALITRTVGTPNREGITRTWVTVRNPGCRRDGPWPLEDSVNGDSDGAAYGYCPYPRPRRPDEATAASGGLPLACSVL